MYTSSYRTTAARAMLTVGRMHHAKPAFITSPGYPGFASPFTRYVPLLTIQSLISKQYSTKVW